jgi:hypothetical protein
MAFIEAEGKKEGEGLPNYYCKPQVGAVNYCKPTTVEARGQGGSGMDPVVVEVVRGAVA